MTGAAFEFTLDDTQIMDALDRLQAGTSEPQPLLQEIGAYGVHSTQARFATETAPDGTRWAALNPAYAELKGAGRNILTRSGKLKDDMSWHAGAAEVSWGSSRIYAAVHQFGATIKPRNVGSLGLVPVFLVRVKSVTIPARPYLGISPADGDEISALGGRYLRSLL